MPAKQQGSAPRAVDWPVRSPATFTRCDLSLSKTRKGAILPQNHSESGECRLRVWHGAIMPASSISGDFRSACHVVASRSASKSCSATSSSEHRFNTAFRLNMVRDIVFSSFSCDTTATPLARVQIHSKVSRRSQYLLRSTTLIGFFSIPNRDIAAGNVFRASRSASSSVPNGGASP